MAWPVKLSGLLSRTVRPIQLLYLSKFLLDLAMLLVGMRTSLQRQIATTQTSSQFWLVPLLKDAKDRHGVTSASYLKQ